MMLPDGWVTDVVTSRTKALKCLGNGVVPAQASAALRSLITTADRDGMVSPNAAATEVEP